MFSPLIQNAFRQVSRNLAHLERKKVVTGPAAAVTLTAAVIDLARPPQSQKLTPVSPAAEDGKTFLLAFSDVETLQRARHYLPFTTLHLTTGWKAIDEKNLLHPPYGEEVEPIPSDDVYLVKRTIPNESYRLWAAIFRLSSDPNLHKIEISILEELEKVYLRVPPSAKSSVFKQFRISD